MDLSKQEYCRALLCMEDGKEKYCGDIVMGKVRYCVRHSQKTTEGKNMINTDKLKDGDVVEVSFKNKETVRCKFINGVFQNVEDNSHKNEVYESSVVNYIKLAILDKHSHKNNQQKKDDEALHVSHLGTRNTEEEEKTMKCKTNVVDNHVENPQDNPGQTSGVANGDTGDGTFPADSKSKLDDLYSRGEHGR